VNQLSKRSTPGFAFSVMPGLVPGIHAVKRSNAEREARRSKAQRRRHVPAWMAGTSPAMTP
jgi:hypothetical protein